MRTLWKTCAVFVLAACLPQGGQASENTPGAATPLSVPAGNYKLDKAHASLIFRVNHLGLSHYTARFTRLDANLQFDPANPAKSVVTATIDPRSIQTNYPDPKLDFDAQLQNAQWLDTAKFPEITFQSTKVDVTGNNSAHITGELALHGVKRPVFLDTTFNGGYAHNPMDPSGSRIGFSAHGMLKRSEFGVAFGVPQAGSNFGVGDDVEVIIEAEFTRPAPPAATSVK